MSPCHSRQPSIISDASALEGDRSSTPSDINSPRHRTHSLCNVRAAHHRTLPSSRHTVVTVDLPFAARLLLFPSTIVLAESMSSSPPPTTQSVVHSLAAVTWIYVKTSCGCLNKCMPCHHVKCHCVLWSLSCGLYRSLCTLTSPTSLVSHLSPISSSPPSRSLSLSFSFFFQSLEDLEEAKRKKKKEKMGLGSLSRVFARGKQRKSLDPGLFDGTSTPDYYIEEDADW